MAADIRVSRDHALGRDEVRARIEMVAGKVADRIGGSWSWRDETAVCEARGARACVAYDESTVSIEVTLPRLLRPLRGRLEGKIEEYFDRYFQSA